MSECRVIEVPIDKRKIVPIGEADALPVGVTRVTITYDGGTKNYDIYDESFEGEGWMKILLADKEIREGHGRIIHSEKNIGDGIISTTVYD